MICDLIKQSLRSQLTLQEAFNKVVVPALAKYEPELIIVSSGFDASALDPLGAMILSSAAFRMMTEKLMAAAGKFCQDRILFCHEGGYSAVSCPFIGLAIMETLSGTKTDCEDPFREEIQGYGYQELQEHQNAVIKKAAALIENIAPPPTKR
jgi:acetoin utilization deacetylase AcuC-like enzyme